MATPTTSWRTERARIAGMSSRPNRPPDDPDLIEARRNLRALRLEEHVQKVLAEAPPLSEEQRNHIAALLRVGGGGAASQARRDAVEDLGLVDTDGRTGTGPHALHIEEPMSS